MNGTKRDLSIPMGEATSKSQLIAVQWWTFYLFALISGAWWTIFSPILMTYLLRNISGVVLLEKTLKDTQPDYAENVANTPAFMPRILPRKK
jgi:steroid 5-alpha reductase family enzyme